MAALNDPVIDPRSRVAAKTRDTEPKERSEERQPSDPMVLVDGAAGLGGCAAEWPFRHCDG